MAIEIERRFLVDKAKFDEYLDTLEEAWLPNENTTLSVGEYGSKVISQTYITGVGWPFTMRVRKTSYYYLADIFHKFTLTIKSNRTKGQATETEMEISQQQYDELLPLQSLSSETIRKARIVIPAPGGKKWEVDEFSNPSRLNSLCIAEMELSCLEEEVPNEPWIIREITGEKIYSNDSLSRKDTIVVNGEVKRDSLNLGGVGDKLAGACGNPISDPKTGIIKRFLHLVKFK